MMRTANSLIEQCREAGQRITGPRRIIAKVIAEADDHPDVLELYRRIVAIDPRISLSTVYRTLKVSATGLIERHSFVTGRLQIEPVAEHHHDHLIDVDTGAVVEFRSDEIERLQVEIASGLGYELTGHRLVLYGRSLRQCAKRRSTDWTVPSRV
jgi:Fur family transcriptional regulator, ferric uptake regulator